MLFSNRNQEEKDNDLEEMVSFLNNIITVMLLS
jgi:hypothetical protein